MADVSINLVYSELKQMRKELEDLREMHGEMHALRYALIPEEETTKEELDEIKAAKQELKEEKAIPWRQNSKK